MKYFHGCIKEGPPSCICMSFFSLLGPHFFYAFSSVLEIQTESGISGLTQTSYRLVLAVHEIMIDHELYS